ADVRQVLISVTRQPRADFRHSHGHDQSAQIGKPFGRQPYTVSTARAGPASETPSEGGRPSIPAPYATCGCSGHTQGKGAFRLAMESDLPPNCQRGNHGAVFANREPYPAAC